MRVLENDRPATPASARTPDSAPSAFCYLALATALIALAPAAEVLASESNAGVVRRYTTDCMVWTRLADFASGSHGGESLQQPLGLARDPAGRVYVAEQRTGGRVLRFAADGTYQTVIGREGVEFSGNPHTLAAGPDGLVYLSTAFGANAGRIYQINPATGGVSLLIGSGLNTPRALAFDPQGRLWIASRGSFSGGNGYLSRWQNGSLTTIEAGLMRPSAMTWDPTRAAILANQGATQDIYAYPLTGAKSLAHDSTAANCLDVKMIEGHLCYTDFDGQRVRIATGPNSTYSAVTGLDRPGHLLALSETPHEGPCEIPGCPPLPGVPIAYSPPSSSIYLGSPALLRCPDGSLLASHDYYGSGSTNGTTGQTFLFRSGNDGTSWNPLGEIRQLTVPGPDDDGVFWNSLFRVGNSIYSTGAESGAGDLVIRRSDDNGASWTQVGATNGRLIATTDGRTHACGVLTAQHAGRIWSAVEHPLSGTFGDTRITLRSAAETSDLLDPASWQTSNGLTRNTAWLGGTFKGWLEACPVPTADHGLVVMLRVDNRYPNGAGIGGKAAIIRASPADGSAAPTLTFSGGNFDPTVPNHSGFVDFPGGTVRFVVRYDPPSQRYWSVCSYIPRAFCNSGYNAERFRAALVLVSSEDLCDWSVERMVMHDERIFSQDPAVLASAFDPGVGGSLHTDLGLQYPFFLIEGDDLLVTVRTAFCDGEGGALAGHDANYYLFKRVERFRTRSAPRDFSLLGHDLADAEIAIRFQGRPARVYQTQTSVDLTNWENIGPPAESPGGVSILRAARDGRKTRFYRIAEVARDWLD
jgi:sugar lactone lactonase YvrE